MSVRRIKAGSTDVSVVIRIVDSTDGTPETGVVFNTSGIDLWYRRDGAASVDITEATLSALTDAHSDGGFLHINDGWYRLDLPDAACASGVAGVQIGGTVTGMVVLSPYIELEVNTAADVYSRIGAPVGASISADVAAVQSGTNDIQTRLPAALVSGRIDASVGAMAANTLNASALAADAVTEIQSGLATAAAVDTIDNFLDTEMAAVLAAVDTEVAAIKAVTDLLPDAGALTSLATQASVNTIDDFLDTEIAAIKAKTDSLTFTVAGVVDANIQRINDVTITGNGQVGTEFGV